ncbi:hypothetical protein PoB_000200700 [Plakobranchus ocellatus]|uniref:CUB domain-containing protein n=1 Tax=Plakobranchus ocellatus TaxID=259542 RepID=A0AAV3Y081_9GAST|nr:hypothetical protein PoB_000200700 [Plakobranchus ocellatus]
MAAISYLCSVISLFFMLLHGLRGNFVMQHTSHCGNYQHPKEERILDKDELTIYSHDGNNYYGPNKDCILTLIGKTYHQWEVTLSKLDVDKDQDDCREESPPCCNDYLKMFNSYRVDNARLFPGIPWRGLCGNKLPRVTSFVSTQNYITIQFNANPVADFMSGFVMRLRQYPRRNSGVQQGYFGGWNDGTLSQLQIDWSAQEQIPADYRPAENPTFDYEPNGISCYECKGCKRDFFESSDIGVTTREGCYICTKEWLQGNAQADRQCLSRRLYEEKLLTLQDTSGGSAVRDYRGCKTFLRGVEGTLYINMCVCDSNKCNKGHTLKVNISMFTLVAVCVYLMLYVL